MDNVADVAARVQAQTQQSGTGWDLPQRVTPAQDDGLQDCDVCGNLRWIRYDVPVTDSRFGKLFPCPHCGAAQRIEEQRYQRLIERIDTYGITPNPDQTFETLTVQGRPDSLRSAKRAAMHFAQSDGGLWLILHGPVGTGKTHMAMAVVNTLRARHKTVLFVEAPGLLDLLRSGYDRGDYDQLMETCKTVDYLLIDDMGTEQLTPWAKDKLYQIVNYRYRQTPPLALMITMNEDPRNLDSRLASRLADRHARTLRVTGGDYRRTRGQ